MTELYLVEWASGVHWYVEALGLTVLLKDDLQRFALLGRGKSSRIALKESREFELGSPSRFRLVFEVADVEVMQVRLRSRAIAVSEIVVKRVENYREVRLLDPEGTRITLFDWKADRSGPT